MDTIIAGAVYFIRQGKPLFIAQRNVEFAVGVQCVQLLDGADIHVVIAIVDRSVWVHWRIGCTTYWLCEMTTASMGGNSESLHGGSVYLLGPPN